MAAHKYIYVTINIEEEGDQFVSTCPELGTASCGDTEQEALDNLREAITVHLNALEEVGERERRLYLIARDCTKIVKRALLQGDCGPGHAEPGWCLHSDNPDYEAIHFDEQMMCVMGRIRWVGRRL